MQQMVHTKFTLQHEHLNHYKPENLLKGDTEDKSISQSQYNTPTRTCAQCFPRRETTFEPAGLLVKYKWTPLSGVGGNDVTIPLVMAAFY